ncbi:MAG: hypothetical protein I8H87_15115 [Comamonadaceae bacterium]|jgi:hypothetical protein|nr:hypothetical protein [Comamonadaceae bacterium]
MKARFGVWSPHRESTSVLAFKASLGLRPEQWVWCHDRQQASLWVVDADLGVSEDWTTDLRNEKEGFRTQGALLARDWAAIEDPVWTFLKLPLQVNIVYRWLDVCLLQYPEPRLLLSGQRLKLKRWPNMSRYSSATSLASGMNLTVACARLLKDWVTYEDAIAIADDKNALDVLLMDAKRDGILETAPTTSVVALDAGAADMTTGESPGKAEDSKIWSLVRRLVNKFK